MTWGAYYRQVFCRSVKVPWGLTGNLSRLAGFIISSLIITSVVFPSVKSRIPTMGWQVTDLTILVGTFLLLFFIVFSTARFFFYTPYLIHQEQEKKINGMKKELETRAALLERCAQFADFIDKGRELHRICKRTNNFPGKDIENWLNKFEKYVGTLNSIYQSEWKKEHEIESIRADAYPRGIGENHKLYETFTSRLTQSENMLTRWREQSEQHGFVQRETNSTTS